MTLFVDEANDLTIQRGEILITVALDESLLFRQFDDLKSTLTH